MRPPLRWMEARIKVLNLALILILFLGWFVGTRTKAELLNEFVHQPRVSTLGGIA
jgi:hypothetical protein